jgi:hypothetical protein
MNGKTPFRPLAPHLTPTGDSWAGGLERQISCSSSVQRPVLGMNAMRSFASLTALLVLTVTMVGCSKAEYTVEQPVLGREGELVFSGPGTNDLTKMARTTNVNSRQLSPTLDRLL